MLLKTGPLTIPRMNSIVYFITDQVQCQSCTSSFFFSLIFSTILVHFRQTWTTWPFQFNLQYTGENSSVDIRSRVTQRQQPRWKSRRRSAHFERSHLFSLVVQSQRLQKMKDEKKKTASAPFPLQTDWLTFNSYFLKRSIKVVMKKSRSFRVNVCVLFFWQIADCL